VGGGCHTEVWTQVVYRACCLVGSACPWRALGGSECPAVRLCMGGRTGQEGGAIGSVVIYKERICASSWLQITNSIYAIKYGTPRNP